MTPCPNCQKPLETPHQVHNCRAIVKRQVKQHVKSRGHLRTAFDLLPDDNETQKARTLIVQAAFALTTVIGDATDTAKQVCDAAWGGHSK